MHGCVSFVISHKQKRTLKHASCTRVTSRFARFFDDCQTIFKPKDNNHKSLIGIFERHTRYGDKIVNGIWIIEQYFCHNTSAI